MDTRPVGFMDSGLGGLSVLRRAVALMPGEHYIYYGDSAHAPYGTRPTAEIRTLALAAAEHLLGRGVKALVVACNTATGAAISTLRERWPDLPILGVEPAIKPAVEANRGGRILMLSTPMTIRQEKYQHLLARYRAQAEIVSVPCPGLMEFVERGELEGPALEAWFAEHLPPDLLDGTETVVLGCTHYPFLAPALRRHLAGRPIALIDGSGGTARELHRRLAQENLLGADSGGQVELENSDSDPALLSLSRRLLAMSIDG